MYIQEWQCGIHNGLKIGRLAQDSGYWEDYCEETGTNEWCVNEGLMVGDEQLSLTNEQAKKWGFIK